MITQALAAASRDHESERKLRLMEHEMQRVSRELAALAILQDEQRAQIADQQARIATLDRDRRRYRDKLRRSDEKLQKAERHLQRMRNSRLWRWTEPLRRLRRFASTRLGLMG